MVGGLERGRYARCCRREAGPRVRFLGAVFDRPALATLRSQAWAVVHGHSVGGTNPSLLEALAAGAPVIAHDNPFNREVLAGEALYFREERSLIEAVRESEAWSAEQRELLRSRGRRRVAERYSWEWITEQYARLLGADALPDKPLPGSAPAPAPGEERTLPAALPARVREDEARGAGERESSRSGGFGSAGRSRTVRKRVDPGLDHE